MTFPEVHQVQDEQYDEELAAEIVRLRRELEQSTRTDGSALPSVATNGPMVAAPLGPQPPSSITADTNDTSVSPRGRLINTAPQTDFVDTSACYKYVESDDDCSGNGMLSYDEVTVNTNDEQFLFTVEDEVTVVEEEVVETNQPPQPPSVRPLTKKTTSLRDHISSHSQHSHQKVIVNPYSKYTSSNNDDDKSEGDSFGKNDENPKNEMEEEDNQSCLSYDEITVTTADLMAELEHSNNSGLEQSLPYLNTTSNQKPEEELVEEEEEEIEVLDEDIGITPTADENKMNGEIMKLVLEDDANLNILPEDAPHNAPKDPQPSIVSSPDSAWTNFGEYLIDPTRTKQNDDDEMHTNTVSGGSVHAASSKGSLTNAVEGNNDAVDGTIVSLNASSSQILSIDDQIRLMQEEMLLTSPVTFQSPLILQQRKKITGSVVSSLDPVILSPGTDTKSPRNPQPVAAAAAASPVKTLPSAGIASPHRSPHPVQPSERPTQKSPKLKAQTSPKTPSKSSKSPMKMQSPQQTQTFEQVQKSQSPVKLDPSQQIRKGTAPMFPKSPVEQLSRLSPLKSPAKATRSPKNTVQETAAINKMDQRPNLSQVGQPFASVSKQSLGAMTVESSQSWISEIQSIADESEIKSTTKQTTSVAHGDGDVQTEAKKKKKTKLVRKVRKKTTLNDDDDVAGPNSDPFTPSANILDQEALDLQAQIDQMQAEIAALAASTGSQEVPSLKVNPVSIQENRPPPMFNLLGAIESAATKRVQRLEETGGELIMQDIAPEVEAKTTNNRQLSTSMAEMISQRAAARDKRLADGGEKRMRKVVIKERDEYKKDFSSIVGDAAAMGRLTRLNEYTVEAVGQPKKPQEEWKSNGLLAIQWRSAHMSVIHDAAAAGNATKMPEHTVSNFPEEDSHHNVSLNRQSSTRMEKLMLLDTKVGEGLRKVDNFILGQKEHQGKVNSLLIKPMQAYSRVEDIKLPRQSAPKIDPVKNAMKLSKMKREALMTGRPMVDISASAAERAWERRARLDRPGTEPKVKLACLCDYCASASPYQTFAYRELERRQKENGEDVKHHHHQRKEKIESISIEHQDTKSIDSDAAQVAKLEDVDEIELKRRERQRIREERRKLQQAVAEAEAAIAKAAADAENAAILKKQLEVPQADDPLFLPTSSSGSKKATSALVESAPSNVVPYTKVHDQVDKWNQTSTKQNPKYKNQPPGVDSAKCTCAIM